MRMATHHRVRTCINHQSGQALLASGGIGLIFNTPMHEGNHHISLVNLTCGFYICNHLLVVAPCRTRPINIGLKATWEKFVVAQNGDGDALALEQHGRVCLLQITSAAKKWDLGLA